MKLTKIIKIYNSKNNQIDMEKIRLDKMLLQKGLVSSRDRAIAMIKWPWVMLNGRICNKPAEKVSFDDEIDLIGEDIKRVSRAGLKLERALEYWDIDVKDKVCIDIWASTWGFCDVLLEWYADKVYAVDVGHSQLHEKIKSDERVVNLEKTNARYLSVKDIPEKLDFLCTDVSFISLEKIIPPVLPLLKPWGQIVALIKPQFELTPEALDRNGVVRSDDLKDFAVNKIVRFFEGLWLDVMWAIPSPIKGAKGNNEYLIYAKVIVPPL